jgi:pyruvate/2-oxoacid:ferredoxin oxidoreductase beta subunit
MTERKQKLPKVFEYFREDDRFAGGIAFCSGCPLELTLRFTGKVLGKDIVFVGTPSCSAPVLYGMNLGAWHKYAYYSCLMTGVASSGTGIARAYKTMGKDITVVCFTGDGCSADVGFQVLSGAAERNENLIYITYDNEGYMNTGIQRSSATPYHAATTTTPIGSMSRGKKQTAKDLPLLMALHNIPYAATATLSHMEDFAQKLRKAEEKKKEGFAYIHVFSPCPVGWGFESDKSIEICRTAVKTNYFPLWEAEYKNFRFTHTTAQPKPIAEYLKMIRKFSHFNEEETAAFQEQVDANYNFLKYLTERK